MPTPLVFLTPVLISAISVQELPSQDSTLPGAPLGPGPPEIARAVSYTHLTLPTKA